jgi:hypothetical protein
MSGWQVNRGNSINNGRVPTAEAPPSVEAELVEEEDQEVYAVAEPEERPDPTPTEELVEVRLRSLIPVTKEDYERGFRLLTDEERSQYGISPEPMVREDAGKKEFNLSSQRVGEHVKELLASKPPFPRGYLFENGNQLSDRCRFEIFQKIENSARKILPGNPADWRNLKNTAKAFNPKYKTHRFKYWEANAKRCGEYQDWLESQPEPEVEIHEGEFTPPKEEPPADREERLSKKRSAIQKAESEFENIIRSYMRQKREIALRIVEEEALETKHQMDLKHDEIVNNPDVTAPPELDEDEDL